MKKNFLLFVVWLLCGAMLALAQETGSGTIEGTVRDQSGAAIPNAGVSITQMTTGLQRTTKTNNVGFYVFQALILGPYSINVTAPDMETYVGTMTLQAGQTAQVDVPMKVGSSATTVTVAANVTPLIETSNGTLSETVDHTRIEQMPLNGRDVTSLVLIMTPGMQNNTGAWFTSNGVIRSTSMTQDGATLTNLDHGGYSQKLPGLDSISQFKVETSNSSAKMETPATIILSTEHGTNQLHGSIFDSNRSSAWGVAHERQETWSTAPFYLRNEFGASLGGPIRFPKIYNGKDKSFFFFSYEGRRQKQMDTVVTTVPTAAMRGGNFSGLVDSAGNYYQLYNPNTSIGMYPWTRQPFGNGIPGDPGNNIISPSLESPVAKYLWDNTPLPTLTDVNPLVANNFYGSYPDFQNQNTTTVRLDHSISQKDQVFLRFSYGTTFEQYPATDLGQMTEPSSGAFNIDLSKGQDVVGSVGWTHTYSSNFLGQTLLTYGMDREANVPSSQVNYAAQLGLPNPSGFPCFPRVYNTGFEQYDCGLNAHVARSLVMTVEEDLTKTMGRHEFEFGGQLSFNYDNTLPDQQESSGTVDFNTDATELFDPSQAPNTTYGGLGFTGFEGANTFLGVGKYNEFINRLNYFEHTTQKILYFQDNWNVSRRLTLNMGVRWEYAPTLHEANNSLTSFDPTTGAAVLQTSLANLEKYGDVNPQVWAGYQALGMKLETPAQAGYPQNLVYNNPHDFNPRAGFAYRLTSGNHDSVIRGGFGLYSYPNELEGMFGLNQWMAPTTGFLSYDPDSKISQSPDGLPNYTLRYAPPVIAGVNSVNVLSQGAGSQPPGSAQAFWPDPHLPTSRAEEWNLTYQREIGQDNVLSFTYVGTHAFRLPQYIDDDFYPSSFAWYLQTGQPYPDDSNWTLPYNIEHNSELYGTVQELEQSGWSNANSFQIELQHQYKKGYGYQIFYVLDNAFRAAGQGWETSYVMPPFIFPPGSISAGHLDTWNNFHEADKLQNYQRDTTLPQHQVNWNWVVDLPFGRGKRFGGDAPKLLNGLIGGWQLSGDGTWYSRWVQPDGANWGAFNGFKTYGKQKVVNCTSGDCYNQFLWFNGYLDANVVNQQGGISGVPSNYNSYEAPLIPKPANPQANDPLAPYYDSNTVCMNIAARSYTTLASGDPCMVTGGTPGYTMTSATVYGGWWESRNWNPYHYRQVLRGPNEWNMDASVFKVFPIGERFKLRLNLDAFNVFNRPGINMPSSTSGLIDNTTSDNTARMMQLTLRLSF